LVEQGGFAGVGFANDGYRNALLEGVAQFERFGELT
jgi:hypothetical protein